MMDPEQYFREADRLELELLGAPIVEKRRSSTEKTKILVAKKSTVTREMLPSGCVLYRIKLRP
jgi:hypothetical protein